MIKRVRSENFNSVLLRSRREHENVKNHYIIHNRYTSLAFEIFPSIITLAPRIIRKTLGVLSPMHEPKKRPSNKKNVFYKASRRAGTSVMTDPWNILEFVTYIAVVIVFSTRVLIIFDPSEKSDEVHRKAYAGLLILMWLHFMKSCRPFTALGPFISMLGHVIVDTGRFTFLFFEFFVPYAAGFWILFGGHVNATKAEEDDPEDWHLFHDSLFSTLQVCSWMSLTLIPIFKKLL